MFSCCQFSGVKYLNTDHTVDRTVLEKIMPATEVDKLLKPLIGRVGKFALCKCPCHVKGSSHRH